MSFYAEVWKKFSDIDIEFMKQKNKEVDYITWSRVWMTIMEHYPDSDYSFNDRRIPGMGDNGPMETVEVSCVLSIVGESPEGKAAPRASRTMHLPVMTSFVPFNAIENPTARHISDSKMRCFVKAAAMFGLGLTLWTGDDHLQEKNPNQRTLDFAKLKSDYRMNLWKTAIAIKEAYQNDDISTAEEAWYECSEENMQQLWLAESKGGFFTMKEKEWIRKLRIVNEEVA